MINVIRSTSCGNSPKNKMVEDIAVAIEVKDAEFLATVLDADAVWNCDNGATMSSEASLALLHSSDTRGDITIDCVMSHGKVGAANGIASRSKTAKRFCHVIEFTSVKCNRVRRIESYNG